jgi:hypothetical protein
MCTDNPVWSVHPFLIPKTILSKTDKLVWNVGQGREGPDGKGGIKKVEKKGVPPIKKKIQVKGGHDFMEYKHGC